MRADGKRLKNVDPMYTVASYVMDKRIDSMNAVTIDIPLSYMQDYLNAKRSEGHNISHMALIISAFLRVIGEFPELNRFIVNKKAYARNHFAVSMVVLKGGQLDHGTMAKLFLDFNDTIFDVNKKIEDFIVANRETPENNGTEKLIKFLLSIPGLLGLGVPLIKWADKHGLLPRSIIDASPFHNTFVISNLASIRTNHIYHHIYEFGTTGMLITMGNSREVPKRKGGEIVFEKTMPFGIVMDERIASGSYFALAFRRLRGILKNPTELENPPEKIVEDPGL